MHGFEYLDVARDFDEPWMLLEAVAERLIEAELEAEIRTLKALEAQAAGRLTARDLGLNVPLYDETAYYNAVRNRIAFNSSLSFVSLAKAIMNNPATASNPPISSASWFWMTVMLLTFRYTE